MQSTEIPLRNHSRGIYDAAAVKLPTNHSELAVQIFYFFFILLSY